MLVNFGKLALRCSSSVVSLFFLLLQLGYFNLVVLQTGFYLVGTRFSKRAPNAVGH